MTPLTFFSSNVSLIRPIALKHLSRLRPHGYQLEDLIQEAILALLRVSPEVAATLESPATNYAFTTIHNHLKNVELLGVFHTLKENEHVH